VIGNLVIKSITQKPQVIEPFGDDPHQFAFAFDIVQEQQQHHAHDPFRGHRFVAPPTAGVGDGLTTKLRFNIALIRRRG